MNCRKRRLGVLLFLVLFAVAKSSPGQESPNIVIILADDLGWGDVSCNQPDGKVQTPAIDALASEGMRFTNAHAPHAVCTPTRYSLLTGRYCWRTYLREGVLPGYAKPLISPMRETIASIAGASLPRWAAEDGIDQSSQLFDPKASPSRVAMVTQSYTGTLSIRRDNWKLVFDTLGSGGFYRYSAEVEPMGTIAPWRTDLSRSGQLYNLSVDPYEQDNRYEEEPAIVSELKAEMLENINSGRSTD